jgi:hypothetical protein
MSPDSPNDRRIKALNKLIYGLFRKDILSENSTLRSLHLVKSYITCYTIVFEIDGDYYSEDVLNWIIISTVDKILEWWDITDSYNLDIECVTRGRRPINKNYFELLFRSYNKNGNNRGYSRDGVDNFHPRFEKMCRWMYNNKYHEYQAAINTTYDPYRYQEYPQAQEFIRQRAQYRGEGIQPGEYNVVMGGESFYQQAQQISQYYNGVNTQEQPIVTATQRVSKLNKLLNKLKL